MRPHPSQGVAVALFTTVTILMRSCHGQQFDVSTPDAIRASARILAEDMMDFYHGHEPGQTPGILPGPPAEGKGDYYWWEGGALIGTMVEYWRLTGDETYNAMVTQGMLHQAGPRADYMPPNVTASLGNDDQGFWALSTMGAAESGFPNPPADQPQWLELAQAVFATQVHPDRREEVGSGGGARPSCGGGLRWQIPWANRGYDYKNTIANAVFFDLSARLARYTRNGTYAGWAAHTFDWLWGVGYIDHDTWSVYDGGHVQHNCTDINAARYSYNAALLAHGSAFLYDYYSSPTEDALPPETPGPPGTVQERVPEEVFREQEAAKWRERTERLVGMVLRDFFPQGVAFETQCEGLRGLPDRCTTDMLSFKGFVHRWLATVSRLAPFAAEQVLPALRTSTEAAVRQCTGGGTGRKCGFYWSSGKYVDPSVDGTSGAGEAMSVLAAVMSLLVEEDDNGNEGMPATLLTGGISTADPGGNKNGRNKKGGGRGKGGRLGRWWGADEDIRTADIAAAWLCTALTLVIGIVTILFMCWEEGRPVFKGREPTVLSS